jgi:hypothetical protein
MPAEGKSRIPRSPKTAEEVAELVLLKKLREYNRVEKFKTTPFYKICNLFNVIAFFLYVEIIVCFMGPCTYENHYCTKVKAEYGDRRKGREKILEDVILTGIDGRKFEFVVRKEIEPPPNYSAFFVGKDFLLHRELKGGFTGSSGIYRIYSSGSMIFLACFVGVISFILFLFNMNMHPHSLRSLTIINALCVLGCILF